MNRTPWRLVLEQPHSQPASRRQAYTHREQGYLEATVAIGIDVKCDESRRLIAVHPSFVYVVASPGCLLSALPSAWRESAHT